jgi:Zinc carboxypeptidase
MKRLLPALVALVLFVSVDPAVRLRLAAWAGPPAAKGELADLASIYSIAAGAVRDTNGDGLADAVAARVVLPAEPAVEDIEAAANIAGRLGFETTALTLPIVLKAPDVTQPASIAVPIIVGRTNAFIAKLVEKGAIDLKPLKPGQGLLTVVSSPLGGPDGIAVAGGDDEGTLNAANELAVNLPRLWGATGARISQAESQTAAYLKSRNAPGTVRGVASMLVDSDRRGLARMTLRVDAAPGDVARTTKAIEELDLAHRRGLEPDTLNYANAAATVVEVWASGRKAAEATVRRSGLNPRTLTPPDDELGRGAIAVAPSAGGGSGPAGARGAAGGGPTGARGGRGAGAPGAGAAAAAGGEEPPAGGRGDVAPVQGAEGAGAGPGGGTQPPANAAATEAGGGGGPFGPQVAPIPAKTFDLANAYSIEGWFGDSYVDLIPDRLETAIVVGDARESFGAAHIATRLGLETTGITLPLARDGRKITNAAAEPNPILVGRNNELVRQLVKIGKARLDDLKPGEGAVQIVPRAFGAPTATVVAGADAAGTEAASLYLARRLPYIWDIQRGALSLADVKEHATDFFAAKTGGAQASLAMREVDDVLKSLEGKTVESFEAKVYLEAANPAFDKFLAAHAKAAPVLKDTPTITVTSQGITDPVTVFDDKFDIPWEVDDFWTKFKTDVLPKVKPGSTVTLETRLSESPAMRKKIGAEAREQLVKAGAKDPSVQVLSAYKQGFLWLTEQVLPELKGKGAKSIYIKIATDNPDLTKKYKFYEVPSRWLHELYPADEIFERDLGIPKANFQLELVDAAKDVYTLEAQNANGQVVYKAAFSPKWVEREYLEKFPGWTRVKVTTGWISATVDGESAIDRRIETDPERFWDIYQQKELPKVYDYVMRTTGNRPTADKQPYHRDFDIEVWMSEPDFRIGIDEEQVSSLESLHEDLYFDTLDFFVAMGRSVSASNARLNAPGKVFPIIHPSREGQAGSARVLYAGNASPRARIEISYKEKGQERPTRIQRDLVRIEGGAPSIVRAVAKTDGLSEIETQIEPRDDREALRAADMVDNFERLHEAGLYKTELSYDRVDRLAFAVVTRDGRARLTVRNTGASYPTNVRTPDAAARASRQTIVPFDKIIDPDESEALIRKLAAFPEVKAYKVGHSYRGRDISIMEITLPTSSELMSVAKYSAYKPTIFISGRQHANEVSSTNHILRLGELLVTDPSYKEILKKVNVILHPMLNPDGAQMAYDLQKLTPNHMLHAGRYSALGQDVESNSAILPESQIRGKVWREWLPDIYLNPHGYPSHEWVQQFAGYVPPGFRTYWSTRGWYTNLSGVRDPREPDLIQATEALREDIVRAINSNPDVRAMDLRSQARYRKWAYGFSPSVYGQEIYKDTAIYYTDPETGEPRGSRRIGGGGGRGGGGGGGGGGGRASMNQYPQVTFNVGMTEAPDETAQGDWLNLVSKAGFSFLMAHVNYLRDGQYTIERIEEAGLRDAVSITNLRVRPVKPGRASRVVTNAPAGSSQR